MSGQWIRPQAVLAGVQGTRARLQASARQALRDLEVVTPAELGRSAERERLALAAALEFLGLPPVKPETDYDREWRRMARERGEYQAPKKPAMPPPPQRPAELEEPRERSDLLPKVRRHPRQR